MVPGRLEPARWYYLDLPFKHWLEDQRVQCLLVGLGEDAKRTGESLAFNRGCQSPVMVRDIHLMDE